jgi:hypothetical protein
MANIKHIGRLKSNKRRLVVPYRTLPNDPYHCLVIFIDTLAAEEHDSLMKLVESASGQQAYELAEVMNRVMLSDGRNMLAGFYKTGKFQKISTADVEMTPNVNSGIALDELNRLIAEQRGVSLEDLALTPENSSSQTREKPATAEPKATVDDQITDAVTVDAPAPLTDEELARQLRSQADSLFKEAQRLRKQADDLSPVKKPAPVKKTVKKTESA